MHACYIMHIVYATVWLSKIRKTEHFSSWKVNLSLSSRAKDELLTWQIQWHPISIFGVQIRSVGISIFSHEIPRLVIEWINSDESISIGNDFLWNWMQPQFFDIWMNSIGSYLLLKSKVELIKVTRAFCCLFHSEKKSYTSIQSIAFFVDIYALSPYH